MRSLSERCQIVEYFGQVNQTTGQPWTDRELANHLGCHYQTIARHRRAENILLVEIPQVVDQPLKRNERDFFLGMSLAYQARLINWSHRHRYVTIETGVHKREDGSLAPEKRAKLLLRSILGPWGTVHEKSEGPKVFLHHQHFAFMLTPVQQLTERFLAQENRFAPVLTGLMAARLSPGGYLTNRHVTVMDRIYQAFYGHFGFKMGPFQRRKDFQSATITIKDLEAVCAPLVSNQVVRSLSFFPRLIEPSQEVKKPSPQVLVDKPLLAWEQAQFADREWPVELFRQFLQTPVTSG